MSQDGFAESMIRLNAQRRGGNRMMTCALAVAGAGAGAVALAVKAPTPQPDKSIDNESPTKAVVQRDYKNSDATPKC